MKNVYFVDIAECFLSYFLPNRTLAVSPASRSKKRAVPPATRSALCVVEPLIDPSANWGALQPEKVSDQTFQKNVYFTTSIQYEINTNA